MDQFVNLHVHSSWSILDGLEHVQQIVDRTKELNQPACALTDHGFLYGIPDMAKYAEKKEHKFIPGCEIYLIKNKKERRPTKKVLDDSKKLIAKLEDEITKEIHNEEQSESAIRELTEKLNSEREFLTNEEKRLENFATNPEYKRSHFILLAQDNEGYVKLQKICSESAVNLFAKKPLSDLGLLKKYGTKGLIGTSACVASILYKYMENDDIKGFEEHLQQYLDIFCYDNFYLEIQPTYWRDNFYDTVTELQESGAYSTYSDNVKKQIEYYMDMKKQLQTDYQKRGFDQIKYNKLLIEYAKKWNIPLVATTDAHYERFEDWKAHEVLMSVQYHDKDDDNNEYKDILMNRIYKKLKPNGYFDTIDELTYRELPKKHKKNEEIPPDKQELLCQEDYQEQDNPMFDKDGKNIYLLNPLRPGMRGHTHYLMSREEIIKAFNENGHETEDQEAVISAIDNTVKIANSCNVTFTWGEHRLPIITCPKEEEEPSIVPQFNHELEKKKKFMKEIEGKTDEEIKNEIDEPYEYLRFLCTNGKYGLAAKGKDGNIEYRKRLEHELNVIKTMGFPSYFLIVYDIMNFCRMNGIATGPGRGCLLPDNLVLTKDGHKPIQNITCNDEVLSTDEKYHSVIKTYEYDVDENIYDINLGDTNINGVTKEHKMLAIKEDDYKNGIREASWYAIEELSEGDYLVADDNSNGIAVFE